MVRTEAEITDSMTPKLDGKKPLNPYAEIIRLLEIIEENTRKV